MDHWPSGIRDTSEFPSVDVSIEPSLREHMKAFCRLDGIGWKDFDKQKQVAGLNVEPQRYRSYRKMYEMLGLIYSEDGLIRLSKLGQGLCTLEEPFNQLKSKVKNELAEKTAGILSRYQLLNPTESQKKDLPEDCDVNPCMAVWKAMLELDHKIHPEEMNRVILRIMRRDQIAAAIQKIAAARANIFPYQDKQEADLVNYLGEQVHTNQPTARIASWFSFAGWGGLLISQSVDEDGFRNLQPEHIDLVREAVLSPPDFFKTDDTEEWTRYYLGDAKIEGLPSIEALNYVEFVKKFRDDLLEAGLHYSEDIPLRLIASCMTKRFVILTGLSGSGKTKLAQAFAKWITVPTTDAKDPFQPGKAIESDRITYYVQNSDKMSVEFINSQDENGTKVVLPRALIDEWVSCIKEKDFTRTTPAREVRTATGEKTKYSTQLNSFETHLKAAAFALIESQEGSVKNPCYEVIPVGADWTNNENILGYADALDQNRYVRTRALDLILRSRERRDLPFFLLLDEMNLSHVERYFSDILSSIESEEELLLYDAKCESGQTIIRNGVPGAIDLPQNLFIIGTVNVDETTYMFSPKVLDRANVLEFRVAKADMDAFLDNPKFVDLETLQGGGAGFAKAFLAETQLEHNIEEVKEQGQEISSRLKKDLMKIFNELSKVGAEFGYRTANEISRFFYFHSKLLGDEWKYRDALDAQIIQKVLPKLHGSSAKLKPILETLVSFCNEFNCKISKYKINRLEDQLRAQGFASFAEA